ncbi:MAG TPA: MDR family MFS transporter [Alphaproteobacteria bacterium]|jgi:EmrB/QacA subfamily drug resistance transporter
MTDPVHSSPAPLDAADPDSAPAKPAMDPAILRSIIFGVLLAMFMSSLDQTIIATAMPTIGRELGNVENLSWVVTAYLLSSTAVTPLYGKLSDIHGRRIMLLIAIAVFMGGSALCALSPTLTILSISRAIQGLGGGGLMALAMTIIADLVSPVERARYQVHFAAVFMTSSMAGPMMGGFIAQHLHWSVIFWINIPIGAYVWWSMNTRLRHLPRHERPHKLDILGAALMICATVPLLLALNWGGTHYAWNSWEIIGLLVLTCVMAALFGLRMMLASEPFLPLSIAFHPVVGPATAAGFFNMGVFIALTIYMPIYFEAAVGLSASVAGLALMPLMACTVAGAQITGRMMRQVRHYRRIGVVGLSGSIVALTLLALYATSLPFGLALALFGVAGIGIGTAFPLVTLSSQNAVTPHQMGTTTALINFFRSLGGAIIVAIFGAIVINGLGAGAHAPGHGATGGFSGIPTSTFQMLFAAAAIAVVIGTALLLLMEERPIQGAKAFDTLSE